MTTVIIDRRHGCHVVAICGSVVGCKAVDWTVITCAGSIDLPCQVPEHIWLGVSCHCTMLTIQFN